MIDLETIPESPGTYLFKDETGRILYIGKAKNLKKRVSSYFTKHDHDNKTVSLLSHITDIDYIITVNELEALILESNLVKAHKPHYNIDLKDSKSFAYILLTDERYPAIRIARRRDEKGTLIGPFVSGKERNDLVTFVKRTFRLRSCRKLQKRPCIRYHMKTCRAPCRGEENEDEYRRAVDDAILLLKGKDDSLLFSLKNQMEVASENEDFEKAISIRDQISAIKRLREHQSMQRSPESNEDIINYVISDDTFSLMVFNVRNGSLINKKEFKFPAAKDAFSEFIVRYYHDNEPPGDLILPHDVEDIVKEYLSSRKGKTVHVTVPKRGERKKLLDLVMTNIEHCFFREQLKLDALREALNLPRNPNRIECFDISHTSGTSVVGAMVRFTGGKPDKKNYRRFKIKTVTGVDDFLAIREIVTRRYSRLKREFQEYPDLVLVDGGQGQLMAAQKALRSLEISLPVAAIAKRNEEVYVPGRSQPLPLPKDSRATLFIREIRDETHRFAIKYHTLLRSKKVRS